MNITRKQFYDQWIRALKSGKYKQVTRTLKSSDLRYCCLGVACDIFNIETKQSLWEIEHPSPGRTQWIFDGSGEVLSNEFLSFLGMTKLQQQKLAELNDLRGWEFKQIAGYIKTKIMPLALARPIKYRVR